MLLVARDARSAEIMLLARTKCDIHLFNTSNIVYNLHFQNGSCSKLISSIFCFIDSNESLSIVFNDSIRFDNVTAALCCFELLPITFAAIFCNLPGTVIGFVNISCVLLHNLFCFLKIVSYLSSKTYMLFGVRWQKLKQWKK